MIVQIVRFKSGLSDEEVVEMYEARAGRYREVPGLIQKIYLRYPKTGEQGAVFLWASEEDAEEFRETDLGQTISSAYLVQGSPDIETAEVVMLLRSGA